MIVLLILAGGYAWTTLKTERDVTLTTQEPEREAEASRTAGRKAASQEAREYRDAAEAVEAAAQEVAALKALRRQLDARDAAAPGAATPEAAAREVAARAAAAQEAKVLEDKLQAARLREARARDAERDHRRPSESVPPPRPAPLPAPVLDQNVFEPQTLIWPVVALIAMTLIYLLARQAISANSNVEISWKVTSKVEGKLVITKVKERVRRATA